MRGQTERSLVTFYGIQPGTQQIYSLHRADRMKITSKTLIFPDGPYDPSVDEVILI